MKRNKIAALALLSLLLMFSVTALIAQDAVVEENAEATATETGAMVEDTQEAEVVEEQPFEQEEAGDTSAIEDIATLLLGSGFVQLFKEGGFTMWPMLVLLIWAIATVIWKIVSLSYAKINVNHLLDKVIPLVESGKYDEAADICANAKGPVAAIMHMGLLKADKSIEAVEKALENASVLEMAFLEKGFIPLSTTINLAPMFGFFGTVVGMIRAFKDIAAAGEVEPTIVASGIQVALITTAAGLAIAIPIQFFNNMFLGMVDGLVMDMQKGSEKLIEVLVEKNQGA